MHSVSNRFEFFFFHVGYLLAWRGMTLSRPACPPTSVSSYVVYLVRHVLRRVPRRHSNENKEPTKVKLFIFLLPPIPRKILKSVKQPSNMGPLFSCLFLSDVPSGNRFANGSILNSKDV